MDPKKLRIVWSEDSQRARASIPVKSECQKFFDEEIWYDFENIAKMPLRDWRIVAFD